MLFTYVVFETLIFVSRPWFWSRDHDLGLETMVLVLRPTNWSQVCSSSFFKVLILITVSPAKVLILLLISLVKVTVLVSAANVLISDSAAKVLFTSLLQLNAGMYVDCYSRMFSSRSWSLPRDHRFGLETMILVLRPW